jgi:hypothetical protein
MKTQPMIGCVIGLFSSMAAMADASTRSQLPPIIRELCKAKDLLRPLSIEFQANIVLSRWQRSVHSWEKGQGKEL